MAGPLAGIRIVEFAGIGPGPFCGMMLADHGAEVIRIDRASGSRGGSQPVTSKDVLARGRKSIAVNLKSAQGVALARKLAASADGIIEGFRPGVMERLGLGPDELLKDNPKLVYGRMTGWGQTGPYAPWAGHDINYISLAGALAHYGRAGGKPTPPINMVGDFGGGGMMLAFGMVAALLNVARGGEGQVIDCAMTDGAASLMGMFYGMRASGMWNDNRGDNLLDGGAHFYDTYECADGKWLAIGAIEPQFHAVLMKGLGLADSDFPHRMDRKHWPDYSKRIADVVRTKSRDEWMAIFENTDACVAPVLDMVEAPKHPHNAARGTFADAFGVIQPAPAPRFSRTEGAIQGHPPVAGEQTKSAMIDWGVAPDRVAAMLKTGALVGAAEG
jgi:alpha-methylacyl-CoA racemase